MIINIHYDEYDLKIAHLKFINRSISITSWCYNIKKLNKESFVDRFIIEPATTVCADLDWRLISWDGRKSQSQVSHWTGRSRESSWYMLLQSVFSPEPVPRARLAFVALPGCRVKNIVSAFFRCKNNIEHSFCGTCGRGLCLGTWRASSVASLY